MNLTQRQKKLICFGNIIYIWLYGMIFFVKINVQSFGKNLFVNVVTGIEKKQQYVYKKTEKHVFF